ncbi:MAG: PBP1A family penicillin-binding protein [Chitinivibrionales bacterium]|nr:PBP1A family penicillin-binding protein [Chitinivibrionales bacterium]
MMNRNLRKGFNIQSDTHPGGLSAYPGPTKGKLWFYSIVVIIFASFIAIGCVGRFLFHIYQTIPSPKELSNIRPSLVSKVYGFDNSLVHEFAIERRFWVPLEDIPKNLQNAVVAIEDRKFYKHWGIDTKRFIGAVIIDVVSRKKAQGASTLTQQLARNAYLTSSKTIIRKLREILTAVKIESYYTKEEVMELYLNMVYLGAGVYGMETAAQRYFNKSVKDLTLNECAVLAGCIQLPERYRPDKPDNLTRTQSRRNTVLRSMQKMGFLSRTDAQAVIKDTVPHNPQVAVSEKAPYFIEMVRKYMEGKYGEEALYNGGLSIYTTLDLIAQDSCDQAVDYYLDSLQASTNALFLDSTDAHKQLKISRAAYLEKFDSIYAANKNLYKDLPDSSKLRIVQTSIVAVEAKTGAILVMAGGRNFKESKFNRATQALRQPGSSFKPFVYTVALSKGYTPATVVNDQPITLETPEGLWRPENFEREFYGPVTIREAVKRSINLVAIEVLMDVGVQEVITYARKAGLEHNLNPVPSLAIGSCEATNIELTSAYTVYPNLGGKAKTFFIEKVVDKNGRILEQHTPEFKYGITTPQVAYMMTSLMTSVVLGGTGSTVYARGFNRPCAGKTGTTNNYTDAWFVGFTPQIACGVWTGVDEQRSMGRMITGSKAAIPIWVKVMKALHRKLPVRGFAMPEGIVSVPICEKSHKIATSYCPTVDQEIVIADQPPDSCDIHGIGASRGTDNTMRRFGSESDNSGEKPNKSKKKLIF